MREAVHSLFERPLYDSAAARELIMAVGPSNVPDAEALAHAISELASGFAFDLWREMQESTPEREKQFKQLLAACQKVLKVAGVADGGELLPVFGQGGLFAAAHIRGEARGEAATMNALRAVDLLRQDAATMLEILGKRRVMDSPKRGRPEVAALNKLVRDLSCLYERVWRRTPGISKGREAEPCGPLVTLMVQVIDRVRSRGIKVNASRDSLRAIWRRLEDAEKMPETTLLRDAGLLDEASSTLSK